MDFYELGLAYLEKGLSVIPVGRNKLPLVTWKQYQTTRPTKDEILFWSQMFKDAQIGIVTGKVSNLIVVDIDSKELDTSWLPETLTARTGSGGFHFYYRYSQAYTNKHRIKESIDVRAEGGMVLAPPSENEKGKYTWINKLPIANFPIELFENEKEVKENYKAEEFEGFPEGQRNGGMATHIGHIVARVHPMEWERIAWDTIRRDNQKNRPPLPEDELRRTFESITNAERRNNQERWYKTQEAKNIELPDDNDEVMLLSEVAGKQDNSTLPRFSTGYTEIDLITKGGFKDADLVVISAQSGHGKTSLAQTFTYHLTHQGIACLWFSYEVLVNEIYDKFKEMGMDDSRLTFSPLKMTSGNLDWVEKKIIEAKHKFNTKAIFIDHLGYLMPKIDGSMEKIEKSYPLYLTQVMRQLKNLAKQYALMIFLPVHLKKTDNPEVNDIAYSAGIAQEADFVFMMDREKTQDNETGEYFSPYTKLTLQKNRPTGKTIRTWLRMENGKLDIDPFYQPIKKSRISITKKI